jgi:hypothetical protein
VNYLPVLPLIFNVLEDIPVLTGGDAASISSMIAEKFKNNPTLFYQNPDHYSKGLNII